MMGIYSFLDNALIVALFILFLLVLICVVGQIGYYLIMINDHMAERKAKRDRQRKEAAEKIANKIYGED